MLIAAAASIFAMSLGITSMGLMAMLPAKKSASKKAPEKKDSPKKKEFTKIRFSDEDLNKKRKPAYYLKIIKLHPDFELILYDHIKHNDGFRDDGVPIFLFKQKLKDIGYGLG
jgi:hypothetical protein